MVVVALGASWRRKTVLRQFCGGGGAEKLFLFIFSGTQE
jgi:hypothetical protein